MFVQIAVGADFAVYTHTVQYSIIRDKMSEIDTITESMVVQNAPGVGGLKDRH